MSKRVVKPLARIGVVEINRGALNSPVHITVMNSEHAPLPATALAIIQAATSSTKTSTPPGVNLLLRYQNPSE